MAVHKSIHMLLDPKNLVVPGLKKKSGKPGRPAGSGKLTARLEIRCKPELLQVLTLMQAEGWTYQGKSCSEIIHAAVKHLAKLDLSESKDNDTYAAVWDLDK